MNARANPPPLTTETAEELEHASRVFFAVTVRAMDQLHASVSPTGLRAMLVLDDNEGCSLGELASRVSLSQSATSRMVERLVGAGFVERFVPGDRRQVRLSVTSVGRTLTRDLVRRRRAAIRAIAATMDPADVEALRTGLLAFWDSAQAVDPDLHVTAASG
jgi:DNA-binding MarR family transcriptional regulator